MRKIIRKQRRKRKLAKMLKGKGRKRVKK